MVELLKGNIQWVIVAALVIAFLQVRLHSSDQIKVTSFILFDSVQSRQISTFMFLIFFFPAVGVNLCLRVDERHPQWLRSHVIQLHTPLVLACNRSFGRKF